jgi:hypothetical protein
MPNYSASFVVDKMALLQVFLRMLRLSSLSIIPPILDNLIHFNISLLRRNSRRSLGMLKRNNIISDIGSAMHTKVLSRCFHAFKF